MMLRPGQKLLAHSVRQPALGMTVRSLSLTPSAKKFREDRISYRDEISRLRKDWGQEHKQKLEEKAAQDRAERRQIVLQRAIRLRSHREKVSRNLESERKKDEERRQRNKEYLAKTHILWEEDQAKKRRQRKAAMDELVAESKFWITPQNKNDFITPELFGKTPTTTGIVTPTSNYWRYEVFVPTLKRLLSPHFLDAVMTMPRYVKEERREGQIRVNKRVFVEGFLNDLIENPVDRTNFRELVQNTVADLDGLGTFDEFLESMPGSKTTQHHSVRGNRLNYPTPAEDEPGLLTRADRIGVLEDFAKVGVLGGKLEGFDLNTLTNDQLDMLIGESFLEDRSVHPLRIPGSTTSTPPTTTPPVAEAPKKLAFKGKYDSVNQLLSDE